MCSTPKMPVIKQEPAEIIKTATRADASVQKATAANRNGNKGFVSDNIRTTNSGLEEDIETSKKKLLGE